MILAATVIINCTDLSSVYALRNFVLVQNVVEDDEQLLNNNMKELDNAVPSQHSSGGAYEPDRILEQDDGGLPWKQPGGVRNKCTCVL